MSRKHPSFAQLIDYIEGEAKLRSRKFSIHYNTYSRDSDGLKREFVENARHLHTRKNGVYLYHEVVSVSRSESLDEDTQKACLRQITEEYLRARGSHQLAYAVLHEDTDNLHFHIVLSANDVGEATRRRLSKAQFADIQTRLEAWVLSTYPQLEQKAVFHKNQSEAEREARERTRRHLSDKGEQMKRRGAKTDRRDRVQETLTDIFEAATEPRHFTELMERAGFTLYTRGTAQGVTDREGNKYRLSRLGLDEAWQSLDRRMMAAMRSPGKAAQEEPAAPDSDSVEADTHHHRAAEIPDTPQEAEAKRRLDEIRAKRAERKAKAAKTETKVNDRDR